MFRSLGLKSVVALTVVTLAFVTSVRGETYELDFDVAPSSMFVDRWMYPFNVTPGSRITAPTFGALGSPSTDERDGQFLIGINTDRLGIPMGQSPTQYRIESARLILTEAVGGYVYDPTYDAFQTYLSSEVSLARPDEDAGRPVELYGLGLRNGFEKLTWPDGGSSTDIPEFSAGSPFGVSDRSTRNAFAVDALGVDVSNNVDSLNDGINGFDPTPFSVGRAYTGDQQWLAPASEVMPGTTFEFEIDVADLAIKSYLQNGLAQGQLGFVISSLHDAGLQGIGDPYVNLATANHFAVPGPKFEITLSLDDPSLVGDFDANGQLDVEDINTLVREIQLGNDSPEFDLNGDRQVESQDLTYWVRDLFGSHLGDANLDGRFNSSDFVYVFEAGEYEDALTSNSTWSTGDWNADGEFSSGDLVAAFQDGGYQLQAEPRVATVPEPSSLGLIGMLGCWLAGLHRCRVVSRHVEIARNHG